MPPEVILKRSTATLALWLISIMWLIIMANSQNNNFRYQPLTAIKPPTAIRPPLRTDNAAGRYRPDNDGRYKASNGGGDGKYRSGNDGKYVHQDVKYIHDNRPDAGYKGVLTPYKGDTNKQIPYKQNKDKQQPYKQSGNIGNNNFGKGSGAGITSNGVKKFTTTFTGTASNSAFKKAEGFNGFVKPKSATNTYSLGALGGPKKNALPKGKGTGEGRGGWSILQLQDNVRKDGYHFLYETENGILAEENGKVEKLTAEQGLRSTGFYEYTGDDGLLYRVEYTADDNGFVPRGDHIPQTPSSVVKLLAYLKENPSKK